jgi:hypothetical protein
MWSLPLSFFEVNLPSIETKAGKRTDRFDFKNVGAFSSNFKTSRKRRRRRRDGNCKSDYLSI